MLNQILKTVVTSNLESSHHAKTSHLKKKRNYYLPCGLDIVTSLALHGSADVNASSLAILTWKYAGCLGSGRTMLVLLSIATTSDMVGLSAAFSCTDSSAMFMHLIISSVWWLSATNDASTSSSHVPSLHNCHAYENINHRLQIETYNLLYKTEQMYKCEYIWRRLTYPRRFKKSSCWWKPEFLFPVMISRINTPKLNTSDFIE